MYADVRNHADPLMIPRTPRCVHCGRIIEPGESSLDVTSFGCGAYCLVHAPLGAVACSAGQTMTLEDVKRAGERAFHSRSEAGEFMWDSRLDGHDQAIWWHAWTDDGHVHSSAWESRGDLEIPAGGWIHEQPCQCEFCSP